MLSKHVQVSACRSEQSFQLAGKKATPAVVLGILKTILEAQGCECSSDESASELYCMVPQGAAMNSSPSPRVSEEHDQTHAPQCPSGVSVARSHTALPSIAKQEAPHGQLEGLAPEADSSSDGRLRPGPRQMSGSGMQGSHSHVVAAACEPLAHAVQPYAVHVKLQRLPGGGTDVHASVAPKHEIDILNHFRLSWASLQADLNQMLS